MGWAIGALVAVAAGASLLAGVWSADRSERAGGTGRWGRLLVLRSYPLVIITLGLGVLLIVPASVAYGDDGGGTASLASVLALVAATLLGGFFLFVLGRNLAGHDPDAGRIAARLSADEPSRLLLTRWLQRMRWRRWLGGFLGVLFGLLLSPASQPDLLILGFAGIMLGSLSAELHHWRPAGGSGPRAAELGRRRLADYTVRREQWTLAGLGLVAAAVAGIDLSVGRLAGEGDSEPGGAWPWSVSILVVLAVVLAMQWRIVTRRRPALPAELRLADDLARRLAVSRGVTRPGLVLALALLGEALDRVGAPVVGGLAWLASVGLWLFSRRLGLDGLLDEPPAPGTGPDSATAGAPAVTAPGPAGA